MQTLIPKNSLKPGTLAIDFDGCLTINPEKASDIEHIKFNHPEYFMKLFDLAKQHNWNIFIVSNNEQHELIKQAILLAGYMKFIDGISYGDKLDPQSKIARIQELVDFGFTKTNFIDLHTEKLPSNVDGPIIFIDDQEENAPDPDVLANVTFIKASHDVNFLNQACAQVCNEVYIDPKKHQAPNFFNLKAMQMKIDQTKARRKESINSPQSP